jgi:hypothetical protein
MLIDRLNGVEDAVDGITLEDLTEDWQDIINELTLSDVELDLLNLEEWYAEQEESLNSLNLSGQELTDTTDMLTEAYNLQKDALAELAKSDYLGYLQEEINLRQEAYDEAKSVLEDYISDEEALIEARRNASESINEFIADLMGSDASPVQSLEYFEGRYAQLLSEAQNADAEDIESAVSNLTAFTSEYLDFAGAYGGGDYNSLFNSVVGDLEALGVDQIDAADAQESELQKIKDLIGSTDDTLFNIDEAIQTFVTAQAELDQSAWMTEELDRLGSIDDNLSLLYGAAQAYYNSIGEDVPFYAEQVAPMPTLIYLPEQSPEAEEKNSSFEIKVYIDGKELKDNHVTWHRTDDEVHAAVRREAS